MYKKLIFCVFSTIVLVVVFCGAQCEEPPVAKEQATKTVDFKAQYAIMIELGPQAKKIYQEVFSEIVRRNSQAIDERIAKAIEDGMADVERRMQLNRIDKSMRTALYSETRAVLKKRNFDFDYFKNLFNHISGVVQRRSNMVDNPDEFVATPEKLLKRIKSRDRGAITEFEDFMDNVFAMSFAYELSHLSLARDANNAEKIALKLLEAQLYFESIQHAIEKADADTVVKELEKAPKEIDVEQILDTVSKAYPKIKDFYAAGLTV